MRGSFTDLENWHDGADAPVDSADAPFNYWEEWVVMDGNYHAEVGDEEEAHEAEKNPGIVEIRIMEEWHRHGLLESEHFPLWIG